MKVKLVEEPILHIIGDNANILKTLALKISHKITIKSIQLN